MTTKEALEALFTNLSKRRACFLCLNDGSWEPFGFEKVFYESGVPYVKVFVNEVNDTVSYFTYVGSGKQIDQGKDLPLTDAAYRVASFIEDFDEN